MEVRFQATGLPRYVVWEYILCNDYVIWYFDTILGLNKKLINIKILIIKK